MNITSFEIDKIQIENNLIVRLSKSIEHFYSQTQSKAQWKFVESSF